MRTDPAPGRDLARHRLLGRWMLSRRWQFLLILPNQVLFWVVILVGFLGTADPNTNFATAITWYVWFFLVFVLMVVVGRGWCAVCPFGGLGEWVQRRALWKRGRRRVGLGRPFPPVLARYGYLLPVLMFLLLTWIEEFFEIAGPGAPPATSIMVLGIVSFALVSFLVFERRTFCLHLCPLSGLIATVGSTGAVAGYRTRDRQTCLDCEGKECMRGGSNGYGCPWFTWPGSAESNLSCGLCSECYKGCPHGNVGLFVQPPLTSVVAPSRRRGDIAWAVAVLWGLVVFQQLNALPAYARLDDWLNRVTRFPGYPNPLDFLGGITAVTVLTVAPVAALALVAGRAVQPQPEGPESFIDHHSRFRSYFGPVMYALIPLVGADYLARQLPKFLDHVAAVLPAAARLVGLGRLFGGLADTRLLPVGGVVAAQVAVVAVGGLASLWAGWRITGAEVAALARTPALGAISRVATAVLVLALAAVAAGLYVVIHAAE